MFLRKGECDMIKYSVSYTDDFKMKHLTFIRTIEEFNFIKDRFSDAKIVEVF